jgi:uncharacterized membrane protein
MNPIVLAILAGLCWGIGELFTRSVLHSKQVGPMTAIMVRTAVALPALVLAWAAARWWLGAPKEQPSLFDADRAVVLKLVCGSGLIAGALAMVFFYWALSVGELTRVKPVAFAVAPATAVVLGSLLLGESMDVRKALGVGLILVGVIVLTAGGHK